MKYEHMKNRAELEDAFAEHTIEGMDMKTMVAIIYEMLTKSYSDLSDAEFITLVQEHAAHLLDEVGSDEQQ